MLPVWNSLKFVVWERVKDFTVCHVGKINPAHKKDQNFLTKSGKVSPKEHSCSCETELKSRYMLWLNSLPNDNASDPFKLKAFADNKISETEMMISVSDQVKNIVGKGENAGNQHFLFFPQCF